MSEQYIPDFSYDDYLTYVIKSGDTPESVALKFGIDPFDLRNSHNRFCPLKDAIGPVFPHHLKFLILKPEEVILTDEEKEKNRKKVVFNDGLHKLSLNYSHGENTYGVFYTIKNGTETQTIQQKLNVKWKAKNEGYNFYEVNRIGKIYINDTEATTMVDEIAEQASAALYPLLAVVDENGQWVYINNFNKIQERWTEVKKKIRKYYKGTDVEKYFSIYDKNLEDSTTLYLSLSKDWFLNAFFNAIHIQYPEILSVKQHMMFPFLAKCEDIQYNVEQKLDEYLDVDKFIVIDINGQLDDERTKTDFEQELNIPVKEYSEQKAAGAYRAKYFLNPNTYLPESLMITCDLLLDIPQKYTITISNLYDKKELVIASRQEIYVDEIRPKKDNDLTYLYLLLFAIILLFIALAYFLSNNFKF